MNKKFILLFLLIYSGFGVFSQEKDNPELGYKWLNRGRELENSSLYYENINTQIDIDSRLKSKQLRTNKNGYWIEVGPNNSGGRCRATTWDPNQKNKAWAGSESGGLWFINDLSDPNATWQKVSDFWDSMAISAIVFDPNNPKIMYISTGCRYINNIGAGVYKSTDAGKTFTRLLSTVPNPYLLDKTISGSLSLLGDMVINSKGEIFLVSKFGLLKSADGGNSWNLILRPSKNIGEKFQVGVTTYANEFINDLEIGKDDIIWVGYENGQIFKSLDPTGNTWKNISLPFDPLYAHVEIGLAPSTKGDSQTVYAYISKGFKDAQLIKSTDAAKTWDLPYTHPDIRAIQAWSNCILSVHPTNPNTLVLGLESTFISKDGGQIFTRIVQGGYADAHELVFNPNNSNQILKADDGGITLLEADKDGTFIGTRKLNGLNTYQAYSGAFENIAGSTNAIGVAQDMNATNFSIGKNISTFGFEGTYCEIDQDEPNLQLYTTFSPIQYWLRDTKNNTNKVINDKLNTGYSTWPQPVTYDSKTNTLFAVIALDFDKKTSKILVIRNVGKTNDNTVFTLPILMDSYFVKLSKTPNVIYICACEGVFRISDLDKTTSKYEQISPSFQSGCVVALDFGETENEMLIGVSSIVPKSLYYSSKGGGKNLSDWIVKDDSYFISETNQSTGTMGLPLTVSVTGLVFNPKNKKQAAIATTNGVWTTKDITATNPNWQPSEGSLTHTRVSDIRVRESDNAVLVSTYGRGIWISFDLFESNITSQVEFLDLGLTPTPESYVKVNWKTKTEKNIVRFVVERQKENENWIEIGQIEAVKNANIETNYSFIDNKPLELQKVSYRVRAEDLSGNIKYSDIKAFLLLLSNEPSNNLLKVYPNPLINKTIKFEGIENEADIVIFDALGRMKKNANSTILFNNQLDVSELSSGIYFLQVSNKTSIKVLKIIIE